MGFFSPLPAPAPPPKLPNPGPALSQDKQSYQLSDASSFAQTSTLHVVGHRAVGGKEVVMQHLIALLGVKDQEAVRKKQDPDSGMNEGGKRGHSHLESQQVLCTLQNNAQWYK